jgi:hypothetical protein
MKYRTSPIWAETKEEFQARVNKCNSIADILRSFSFVAGAANYKTVYARVKEDNIDISHIKIGPRANAGRPFLAARKNVTEYLYNGSTIDSKSLKKKIFRDNILEKKCSECGVGPFWCNKPLTLQLHHINGDSYDNRLENLCILCPNCHTQTDTFVGRHRSKKVFACVCGAKIHRKSKMCHSCANSINACQQKPKANIAKEDLAKLVWEKPTSQIANDLGISDTTVKKYCKRFGISKPPRGYWQKVAFGKISQ